MCTKPLLGLFLALGLTASTLADTRPDTFVLSVRIDNPASSTDYLVMSVPTALTITRIKCIVDPGDAGESIPIDVEECDGPATTCSDVDSTPITCSNTGATDDGTITDPNFASGGWLQINTGTMVGTPDFLVVTISGTK